ncbi:MAG: macro domain-containing protein [Eubacteriales bacterium]
MISVIKGDITGIKVDAIVNAANNHLWMGAGVAGAIKRKGGQVIEDEAVAKGPIPVGEAVATGAGALPARYVIHAAAMGQDLATDEVKVRSATRNALRRAQELGVGSIAFPALGTGVGGFSLPDAARVMVCEARRHIAQAGAPGEVVFALFDDAGYDAFGGMAARSKVVCLGDSITYGYPYGNEYSWVALAANALGMEMVNAGASGDTTGQMRVRFDSDAARLKPAYVIILGGANDAWLGVELPEAQENLRYMVNRAFAQGICPVLGLPTPVNTGALGSFPQEDVTDFTGDLDLFREWTRDFAGSETLPVLDFYNALLDHVTGKADSAFFVDDGHPNQNGYRVMFEAVRGVLRRLKSGVSCT